MIKNRPVALVDDGSGVNSRLGAILLSAMGSLDVAVIDDGLGSWVGSGRELETGCWPAVSYPREPDVPQVTLDPGAQNVLDVRGCGAYVAARVPGSAWLSRGRLHRIDALYESGAKLTVVDEDGGALAARAVEDLRLRGYDAALASGGVRGWTLTASWKAASVEPPTSGSTSERLRPMPIPSIGRASWPTTGRISSTTSPGRRRWCHRVTDLSGRPTDVHRPIFGRGGAMNVVAVIGNPNPGGRTTTVGRAVAVAVAGADAAAVDVIELAPLGPHLFEWGNAQVAEATAAVASADIIIVACPTYKATYTGLLKAFLDNYGNDGLVGCKAVPVMVGAAPEHALAPEVSLRPVLVELGASVPSRGLYVLDTELDQLDATIGEWLAVAGPLMLAGKVSDH